MYVHVTDKEKDCGKQNLYISQFLGPDDQHHSESSVFLALGQYIMNGYVCTYGSTVYIGGQHYSVLTNHSTDKHETWWRDETLLPDERHV